MADEHPEWMSRWQDPDRHRAQVRARNRAYYAAVKDLIAEYPEQYRELYAREAARNGVNPRPKLTEAEEIEKEIARLQRQLDRAQRRNGEERQ